jgi:hypothetical protein
MKVVKKDGSKKTYKLTLKDMSELGYSNRIPARWHYTEYRDIIEALETLYPELKGNIEKAYL